MLAAAVAAWATTEVTPEGCDTGGWALCQPCDLLFQTETINVLDYHVRPNGTAAGASQMFTLLPTFLAHALSQRGCRSAAGYGTGSSATAT